MRQPVMRALSALLLTAGVAHADSSPPREETERQMRSEWRLSWPAILPCRKLASVDVIVDQSIDVALHGKKTTLSLSGAEGQAIGVSHAPAANRRYPLPASFVATAIDRVTASRADAALAERSSVTAEQRAMESALAELAHTACRNLPCTEATRAMLAAPMQAGAPSEVVPDSSRGDGWRARFARPQDSLSCWVDRDTRDHGCALEIGKISLANFELMLRAIQRDDGPLWLTISTRALEAARP